jgi:tRNA-dihydrouridine synthase B
VHGRTRACRFQGPVEYHTIGEIQAAVNVPVFANGDIVDVRTARRVRAATGADGVMIGRAALGAPWLPGQIAGVTGSLTLAEKLAVMREHLRAGHAFYGGAGVRVMRKHMQWYLEKLTELGDPRWRRAFIGSFNRLTEAREQLDALAGLEAELAA